MTLGCILMVRPLRCRARENSQMRVMALAQGRHPEFPRITVTVSSLNRLATWLMGQDLAHGSHGNTTKLTGQELTHDVQDRLAATLMESGVR